MAVSDDDFCILPSNSCETIANKRTGLMRLFSSSLFDSRMAIAYLWKFNNKQAGIQYAILERLRHMPNDEVAFFLPQLCHILVCNAQECASLEQFILERCQASKHAATFVMWYFENYLYDFHTQLPAREALFYERTVRLLGDLQHAVFSDHVQKKRPSARPGADDLPGVAPTLVAVGCILANIPVPDVATALRPLVFTEAYKAVLVDSPFQRPIRRSKSGGKARGGGPPSSTTASSPPPSLATTIESLHAGNAFSFREYFSRAAMNIAVKPPSFMALASSRATGEDGCAPSTVALYYFAEMQFVVSLLDIAARLLPVSKDGRQNALAAELALVNHNLPASLCLPLWCSDADCHHRILRISPKEGVVLNSAERVPYMVQIEVLDRKDGLDDDAFALLIKGCEREPATTASPPPPEGLADTLFSEPPTASSADEPASTVDITAGPRNGGSRPSIASLDQPLAGASATAPLSEDDFSERMRTAAIMLAQLSRQSSMAGCSAKRLADIADIRSRIIAEMETLEKNRLFDALQKDDESFCNGREMPIFADQRPIFGGDDPSAAVFQESLPDKARRIQAGSPYGHLDGWRLISVIVKTGAEMRQEQLACQIISEMARIWAGADLKLWTFCYRVLVASPHGGLVETVPNAISIHSIKKTAYMKNKNNTTYSFTIRDHFIKVSALLLHPPQSPSLPAR